MTVEQGTLAEGYALIATIEGRPDCAITPEQTSSRRLAILITRALDASGLETRVMPANRAAESLILLTSRIAATVGEANRNRIGRQIYQSVRLESEQLVKDSDREIFDRVSNRWLEKTFPGRLERWQKESTPAA